MPTTKPEFSEPDLFSVANDPDPALPTKEEEIAELRARVLQAVETGQRDTIRDRVAWLLSRYPDTRDSDVELQIQYWLHFDRHLYSGGSISVDTYKRLTSQKTIARYRAEVQNTLKLYSASDEVRARRKQMQQDERQKQRPRIEPELVIYIDETGKNEPYFTVGSAWFESFAESLSTWRRFEDWRIRENYSREMKFVSLSDKKLLPMYIRFVDEVLKPTVFLCFKAITRRHGGIPVDRSIIEMTQVLVSDGIQDQHDSGRARLPRQVSVIKDIDQPGIDDVLRVSIRERLKARFGTQIEIGQVEMKDSETEPLLQITDLFVGSVNRYLNHDECRGDHAKDQFARYLLDAVGFGDRPYREEREGDTVYYIT